MSRPDDPEGILARYASGPELLARTVAGLQDAELDAPPARGGWTIRQITHHVVDGDDVWKAAIKAALGNQEDEFFLAWYWRYTQDEWAARWAYERRPIDVSLSLLEANRAHVLQLLEHAPEAWNRATTVRTLAGEVHALTVGGVIAMQADHVEHHVERIVAIKEELGVA